MTAYTRLLCRDSLTMLAFEPLVSKTLLRGISWHRIMQQVEVLLDALDDEDGNVFIPLLFVA